MKRSTHTPRPNWQQTVESQGLLYHTPQGNPYWNECAYYEFSLKEIEHIEAVTNELYELYLKAAEHVIAKNRFSELKIPERAVPYILRAWEEEPPSLYGRMMGRALQNS
jgi:glutathionylspermidine synthase